ncbi:hypothetical protein M0R45_005342 [Rubus argutus]|uniref:Uncharacterized protein n=1 Tax=Rubus argutus TaxID=59490 RepID=A0AAW1YMK0_RUBAR
MLNTSSLILQQLHASDKATKDVLILNVTTPQAIEASFPTLQKTLHFLRRIHSQPASTLPPCKSGDPKAQPICHVQIKLPQQLLLLSIII